MIFELISKSPRSRYYYCRDNHLALFPPLKIDATSNLVDSSLEFAIIDSSFDNNGILSFNLDSDYHYLSIDDFLNQSFAESFDSPTFYRYSDFYESNYRSIVLKSSLPSVISFSDSSVSRFRGAIAVLDVSDFDDKGLYPELLDNSQQRAEALSYILDTDPNKELDPALWDDTYLKFCRFIEEYNKNVLLLRSTRKVDIENTILTASTDSSSSVNLSGIENKLQSISDKLQTTEIIDNSQKSITDVLNQQANTIQVDEIGLLRSKKGYY